MLSLLALVYWLSSDIALGQVVADTLEGLVTMSTANSTVCSVVEQAALTWPIFGQVFAMLSAGALFLRPFSNMILKVALVLSAMPNAAAGAAGKALWVLGTVVSIPAAGTPGVMKKVYAGEISPPTKKKTVASVVVEKDVHIVKDTPVDKVV